MIFDASEIEAQEKYRLLNGAITPRPIAWISTRSSAGVDNLAPYSFFTVASCNPPVLLYTQVGQRSGIEKDTLQNLRETGECVVHIVNSALLEKMNMTSANIDAGDSEFDFADLESCDSHTVAPRSVKHAPVRFECTLREVVAIGEGPGSGTLVLLDVKLVYVRDELYNDGTIDQTLIDSVGKMGGDYFSFTSENVALKRPQ
jgi:flavin reductase (DIM6/NTAB) family NADH-FMN oxidoreductase RutF